MHHTRKYSPIFIVRCRLLKIIRIKTFTSYLTLEIYDHFTDKILNIINNYRICFYNNLKV